MKKILAALAVLITLGASSPTNNLDPEDTNTTKSTWTYTYNNHKYYVVEEAKDIYDAENQCVAYGGHLIAPSTQAENDHHKIMMAERYGIGSGRYHWIGFHRRFGHWIFLNGEKEGFTDWASGEPNENADCRNAVVTGEHGYRWADEPCSRTYWFTCET